jgi:hypothetical protein
VTVAQTVPHPPGQSPGQEYVSFARQAGGVQTAMNVSVGEIGSGTRVSVAGGAGDIGTNKLHAMIARSAGMRVNRFIFLPFYHRFVRPFDTAQDEQGD